MSYGLKIYNTAGVSKLITPDDGTVIAAGSTTMSNSLEGDNTYGEDIALGATYDEDEISVLVVPRRPIFGVTYNQYIDGGTLFYNTFYLDSAKTYYTRNTANGVMTSFSAGNKTVNQESTWNPVLSVFPIAFWDKKGASTFSSVRLFAATVYLMSEKTNLSLAGSVSGSGGNSGSLSNIKDDNTATSYGSSIKGDDTSFDYSAIINLGASYNIEKLEIYHYIKIRRYDLGQTAQITWYVDSYFDSSWTNEMTATVGYVYNQSGGDTDGDFINSITIRRLNVTKIRVRANGTVYDWSGYGEEPEAAHLTQELKVWTGINNVVYSIGNQGITTVDYMICRKRFT